MTTTLIYILKVNALLSIVYLFYFLFLRKETFVKNNRLYFLIGILTSFLLPLLTYTKTIYVEREPINLSTLLLTEANEDQIVSTSNIWSAMSVENQLITVYLIITLLFLVRLITKSYRLLKHINQLKGSSLGNNILVDVQSAEAYSFWKWIVLPKNYTTIEQVNLIVEHEQIHVNQKHSIDILLIEFVKGVFWFNPILILLQKAINLNLEYIVDDEMSKRVDIYDYQMALVQFEYGKNKPMTMVNSFSTSDLKKRVLMLNTQKSTIMKKLKFVMITPVVAGFFFLFQVNVKAETLDTVSSKTMESFLEDSATDKVLANNEEDATREGKKNKTLKTVATSETQDKLKQDKRNADILEIEAIKSNADQIKEEADRIHSELKEKRDNHLKEIKEKQRELREDRQKQLEQRRNEISAETKARNEKLKTESDKRRVLNEERLKQFESEKGKRKAKKREQELENTLFMYDGKQYTKEEFYALNISPTDIQTVSFYKKSDAAAKFDTPSDKKVIEISTTKSIKEMKNNGELTKFTVTTSKQSKSDFEGVIFVDGKKISKQEMNDIDADKIESMSVLKGANAIEKYGSEGANGVIEIVLKK